MNNSLPASPPTQQDAHPSSLDFQVVILAGGLGTRLHPITEQIPKPLVPVNGEPFLQHQLQLLRSFGLRRALLLVRYLGDQIEHHFGEGHKLDMQLSYSYEATPLGTGGALKNAEALLDDQFLLLNGDTLLFIDYRALITTSQDLETYALIVAFKPLVGTASGAATHKNNLAVAREGIVTAYDKRNRQSCNHIDAGAIVLRRKVLDLVPGDNSASQPVSLEEEIFPQLIAQHQMRAWITPEPFYDMGSPRGLKALERRLSNSVMSK